MKPLVLVGALLLSACGSRSQVKTEEGASLSAFRNVAVLPFADDKGQGKIIAEELSGQLRRLGHHIVDAAAVSAVLAGRKTDESGALGLETLERLRSTTGVDAFIAGRVLTDWSAVTATVIETELGDPVIRAVVRPRERSRKVFRTRDELIERLTAALMGRP
jgi:hypothetical protein